MDETHYGKAYEEAINILKNRTELEGWDRYIQALVACDDTEVACDQCHGNGYLTTRAFAMTIDTGTCAKCSGMGIMIVPRREPS
jgi:excinuclease UvrABC ATPase subunit